ncbi:hypothetical protein [Kribbella sp. CA-294648]|uniref:hypothetical protein n=1 Tax=Kribbella sp. CA-294648 TaxID=3239948 RepID=UPI003D8AD276
MFTRATGIGLAVAVLAAGGLATAAVARSQSSDERSPVAGQPGANGPSTSIRPKAIDNVPALEPAQVSYQQQNWGDPKTELGIVIQAPTGWTKVKLSTFEAKFTSSNGLWNLRVNGVPKAQQTKTAADAKYALISSSAEGFELVSRESGTTRATNPAFAGVIFHHRTLTYTYNDPKRGRRLVIDRFVSADNSPHMLFELSTGGRPQDAAGLAAITTKATEDFIRLP